MVNLVLYYCITPFLIVDGVYLIWRSSTAMWKVISSSKHVNLVSISWDLASFIIGFTVLILGILIAFGIIASPSSGAI